MKTSMITNPLELLGIICNLLGVVHHHASFFQLLQIILILNLVWFHCFLNFMAKILKILTYTLRNLRRYVLPSMTNHVMKRPLGWSCSLFLLKTRQKLGLILWDLGQLVLGKRCKLVFLRNFFQFIWLMHLKVK